MEQVGDVAAETISVLLMKPLLIVPCLRHRTPHRCGDPDPSRTTGQTSVDSSNQLALNAFGKWTNMVLSPFLGRPSAWDQMTKAATMRRGFICICWFEQQLVQARRLWLAHFASQNDLQILHTELKNDISARLWVTFRSRRNCATSRTWCSLFFETCVTIPLSSSYCDRSLLGNNAFFITEWPGDASVPAKMTHAWRVQFFSWRVFILIFMFLRIAHCTVRKCLMSKKEVYVFSESVLCLERWIRTRNQILSGKTSWRGSRVHHNTELWTQLMVSQWNSSGFFPRIHHIAAVQQSPRVHVKNERKVRIIYRTDHLRVDVQRHLMGISRQWTGMRI